MPPPRGVMHCLRSFELLCRVADVPETGALPAADEMLRAHLLREAADENRPADAYLFTQ